MICWTKTSVDDEGMVGGDDVNEGPGDQEIAGVPGSGQSRTIYHNGYRARILSEKGIVDCNQCESDPSYILYPYTVNNFHQNFRKL